MIIVVHENARSLVNVFQDGKPLEFRGNICKIFWEIAKNFPDEIIVWIENEFLEDLNTEAVLSIVNRDFIMASYASKNKFLPDSIGFVDQLPFININREISYPTWQMSSDVGAIKGRTLHLF
ncbi:MAG: glycosyltransferase family 2 protein, partial [Gillisia sp.]